MDGLFKGLGAGSREPVARRGSNSMSNAMRTSQIQFEQDNSGVATHTASRDHYQDPGVVFARSAPPYKNASVVPLQWNKTVGAIDYRTEASERYTVQLYKPRF